MKKLKFKYLFVSLLMISFSAVIGQPQRVYNPPPMNLDVNKIQLTMNKMNGEGGLATQFSWMLTGSNPGKTEIFYYPRDRFKSNMLYQIYSPVCLDDNGIKDTTGQVNKLGINVTTGVVTNSGATDWAIETRRYRPPHIIVDGIEVTPPYKWFVDPKLPCDMKLEFEDVCGQFGLRTHVEIFAFSNPMHSDYFIWKATHKFTGELRIPKEAAGKSKLPDQSISFYWPIAWSFGPTKAGEYYVNGSYGYEGEDDLDSWFAGKSKYGSSGARDSLYVAYYWDSFNQQGKAYTNGSMDNTGDPDRTTGILHASQIPGYALLYADKSASDKTDDRTQPYAITHGSINDDFWGHNPDYKALYSGNGNRGRFPVDVVSAGYSGKPDKGPMRFITTGPYTLTKNAAQNKYDSLTFVYAVGVGDIGKAQADSCGILWFNGKITDAEKKAWIFRGKDSLFQALDRANWAWNKMSKGETVPAAPAPPDITVSAGPDQIQVQWGYPDASYFLDAVTGVDDWDAWRVYRKRGAFLVDDPLDKGSGSVWEVVFETKDRNVTTFIDKNVERGQDYYYAVTAFDNGKFNNNEIENGMRLESSRFQTASQLPVASYKKANKNFKKVMVVPNPATLAAGKLGFEGNENKIIFVNLPMECTLKIYTETGDLVRKVDHNYGKADAEWDQRTDGNQYVSSGIYILVVTDAKDEDGKPVDNQFVKFVIVR
jgi:hypothetical protein